MVVGMGHDPTCLRCTLALPESPWHCLWICPRVQLVWRPVCLLLTRIGVCQGFVTWGAVLWLLQFMGPHLFFEGEPQDPVFMLDRLTYHRGDLSMLPRAASAVDDQPREPIFPTIASLTLWCIWKTRMHVLSATPSSSLDTLRIFWSELVHTLRSQWDTAQGPSRAAERSLPFFALGGGLQSFFTSLLRPSFGIMLCRIGLSITPLISHLDTYSLCI